MKSSLLNLLMFISRKTLHIFLVQVMVIQLLMASSSNSQELKDIKLAFEIENARLEEVFEQLETVTSFKFGYSHKVLSSPTRYTFHESEISLEKILKHIAEKSDLSFRRVGNQILFFKARSSSEKSKKVSQDYGFLSGIIQDESGNFLSFASVAIKELGTGTTAGQDGKFNLRLPEGTHIISVSYVGYTIAEKSVRISANQTTSTTITLKEDTEQLDEVVVYGVLTRGQAKALNEQKNADNIKNVVSYEQFSKYPDRNAAEALQRIPGIAISRDQGEGELVSIRGMSPRFNAVQVNGQRIPSPDPGTDRAVGLDLLQVDLMESIVVNKTLMPDMDGDAIGGTVNFRLKQAPEQPILNISASGGINQQQSEFDDFGRSLQAYSVVAGNRFFDKKLGIIAAASYYRTDRGSLLHQYTYVDNTEEIEEKRNNDYDVRRERYGITFSPDFRFNENHSLKLVANYNVYDDDEIRRRVDYLIGDGEEEREIRNRGEYQTHYLYQLIGEHKFRAFDLDYNVSFTEAREEMPDRTYWRFARDVDYSSLSNEERFNLTVLDNPGGDDPLFLNRLRFDNNVNEDRDFSSKLDIKVPVKLFGLESEVKVGGKLLYKERLSDQMRSNLSVDSDVNPVSFNGGTFSFEDVRYNDPEVAALGLGEFVLDEDRGDGQDYKAEEDVQAFYGKFTLRLTQRLSVVTGARFERTVNKYTSIRADDFNEINSFDYSNILPSAQFRYTLSDNALLRIAYSTGFTRPPFSSLIPGPDNIDEDERVIFRRNPEIGPSTANNVDIIFEKYSKNLGLISLGAFGKFIDDQILTQRTLENIDGTNFTVFRSINGESARSIGVEASFVHKFINDGFPLLKWFGINLNYTYASSEQKLFSVDDDGQVVSRTLPFESPEHVFNLGVFYDNPNLGLTFTISGNYRDAIFIDPGNDEFSDVYFDSQFHMDASASKTIKNNFSVFVQLNNLTDQLEEEVFGNPTEDFSRIHQTEGYGFWGSVGLRYKL